MSGRGYTVTLRREGVSRPWGIRLVGGCDLSKPLIITRAVPGSPADGQVKPGDIVLQIGDYDARDIRHEDAQNLFTNAGTSIKLVIHREGNSGSSRRGSREWSDDPLGLPRAPSSLPDQHQHEIACPTLINPAILEGHPSSSNRQEINDNKPAFTDQPYRTTPLVLPGAKVKKDVAPTESYLRHHPNPMFRQAPPHPLIPHDLALKQKVADSMLQRVAEETNKQVAHKQFNSPIGLYSEQNIADTISNQTGISPEPALMLSPVLVRPNHILRQKKTVVYDPAKSDTYKALHDQELGETVHEVTPVPSKLFTPIKRSTPHPLPGPHTNVNPLGTHEEIQQSNTFKRLMHMVQSEGVY